MANVLLQADRSIERQTTDSCLFVQQHQPIEPARDTVALGRKTCVPASLIIESRYRPIKVRYSPVPALITHPGGLCMTCASQRQLCLCPRVSYPFAPLKLQTSTLLLLDDRISDISRASVWKVSIENRSNTRSNRSAFQRSTDHLISHFLLE